MRLKSRRSHSTNIRISVLISLLNNCLDQLLLKARSQSVRFMNKKAVKMRTVTSHLKNKVVYLLFAFSIMLIIFVKFIHYLEDCQIVFLLGKWVVGNFKVQVLFVWILLYNSPPPRPTPASRIWENITIFKVMISVSFFVLFKVPMQSQMLSKRLLN